MNIRHEILDWFGPSRRVIVICQILIYYAIDIDSLLFLSASSSDFRGVFRPLFWLVFDVDLSSLFIVGEPSHRI
jgi:hypothetical protein